MNVSGHGFWNPDLRPVLPLNMHAALEDLSLASLIQFLYHENRKNRVNFTGFYILSGIIPLGGIH